jgi:hypothetical protein
MTLSDTVPFTISGLPIRNPDFGLSMLVPSGIGADGKVKFQISASTSPPYVFSDADWTRNDWEVVGYLKPDPSDNDPIPENTSESEGIS